MTRFVRERVEVKPGCPVFGTVVIDCDHVVLLKISDELLGRRVAKRNASFEDAKGMQRQLENEVRSSGIPWRYGGSKQHPLSGYRALCFEETSPPGSFGLAGYRSR